MTRTHERMASSIRRGPRDSRTPKRFVVFPISVIRPRCAALCARTNEIDFTPREKFSIGCCERSYRNGLAPGLLVQRQLQPARIRRLACVSAPGLPPIARNRENVQLYQRLSFPARMMRDVCKILIPRAKLAKLAKQCADGRISCTDISRSR